MSEPIMTITVTEEGFSPFSVVMPTRTCPGCYGRGGAWVEEPGKPYRQHGAPWVWCGTCGGLRYLPAGAPERVP